MGWARFLPRTIGRFVRPTYFGNNAARCFFAWRKAPSGGIAARAKNALVGVHRVETVELFASFWSQKEGLPGRLLSAKKKILVKQNHPGKPFPGWDISSLYHLNTRRSATVTAVEITPLVTVSIRPCTPTMTTATASGAGMPEAASICCTCWLLSMFWIWSSW